MSTNSVRVKLIKLSSTNAEGLRTNEVEGSCKDLPTPGEQFQMTAEPIDKRAVVRGITTSLVQSVAWIGRAECNFNTQNTLYNLKMLDK